MNNLINLDLCYPNMRVARFSLKAGEVIPLHLHKDQFGLVYLLYGKCSVITYHVNEMNDGLFRLQFNNKEIITANTYTVLTPNINAHEIEALEECTFLDIFSPGKSDGPLSSYLQIMDKEENTQAIIAKKISIEKANLPSSLKNDIIQVIKIT